MKDSDKDAADDNESSRPALNDEDALDGGQNQNGKSMNDLNLAFQEKVDSIDFYDQAKARLRNTKGKMEMVDIKRAGMRRYFEAC